MSYARRLLDTYQRTVAVDPDVLSAAIEAMNDCAQACGADVDANLSEPSLADMVKCIRLCLHCVDVCTATSRVTSRPGEYEAGVVRPLLQACLASCRACGDECQRHAHMHEHCRICAEACRRCEQACQQLLTALE
jgi:hypothetical protein